ncbi:phage tail family protein [Clostridium tagluense]|uniref:distal tail protein Dit n=1 Tax=Clostridium tagluense TaxID=360422 RepID=UPI001CF2240D|nr:distal tail protein Dit [Clostridium tagluense]MCB2311602.1 phage tail family protein [Clostridium tagluense]MCB2316326.1 phage tail family protein [Clostridium tagluense]MCB2321290.1 phage tail family protein [Clostridium tagluense]MCB2326195.1 phage tail family protein [Clostridium tagluense]MCB2331026.1 phage tail family protein [Clostridium tagluense]
MYGLTFNGKHSYNDFGIYLESKSLQAPSKKKIKVDVPFMNSTYDFSTIGSGGEIVYNQRDIVVKFGISSRNKETLYSVYSDVLQWLLDIGKSQLIFDDINDYYFLAEVESITSFEEVLRFGKFEAKFIAEPFKISIDYVGDDIWDTFNFLEDITQYNEFDIIGTKLIKLYNIGRAVAPIITVNSNMSIIIGGKSYNLQVGDNNIFGLKLQTGDNWITINGNGHIKISFKKVRL